MNTQKDNIKRSADTRLDERYLRELDSIVNNKELMSYTFKKTRRYASVVHLATRHIGQTEPIVRQLRAEVTAIVVVWATRGDLFVARTHVLCVLSLLEVASFSRLISYDNGEVLRREAHLLLELLRQCENVLAQDEARSSDELLGADIPVPYSGRADVAKTNQRMFKNDDVSKKIFTQNPKTTASFGSLITLDTLNTVSTKSSRGRHSERILSLLSPERAFSISDIRELVPDIPPKTLQRELTFLVNKKALNKAGSRRWSTYTMS